MTQPARRPTILVVDDESALRLALAFDFELRDFRVLQAENGRQALEILESDQDIDIVLTDVLMPVMGGVELLTQIRSSNRFRQPGVVFLTGYSELTLEDAHDRGAEAFFGKPFERIALIEAVDRLLLPPQERWKQSPGSSSARRRIHVRTTAKDSPHASVRLGRGGFFLSAEVAQGFHMREEIDVHLEFGSVSLEGRGRVLWLRTPSKAAVLRPGAGVEWLSVSEPSLRELLEKLGTQRLRAYVPRS